MIGGISDRVWGIWMFMLYVMLAILLVGGSIALTISVGWYALIVVIPLMLLLAPPIVWILYDSTGSIIHNDLLWRDR